MESYGWISYHLPVRMCKITKPTMFLSQLFKPQRHVGIKKWCTDDSGSCCLLKSVLKDVHTTLQRTHRLWIFAPPPSLSFTKSFLYMCFSFLLPTAKCPTTSPHSIPSIPNIFLHFFPLSSSSFSFFPPSHIFPLSSSHSSLVLFYLWKNIIC